MDCLRVRWGGSLDELNEFVEQSRKEGLPYNKLRELEAIVAEERGIQNEGDGDYTAAARDYRNATDLGREQCLPCLANALVKAGKYEQGIDVYSRAIDLVPNKSGILSNRGAAYMKIGKVKEGLADWNAAAHGGDAYAQNELGRLYMMGVPGILTADRRIGIEWFRKAAAQGNAAAIQNLDIASKSAVSSDPRP
jgi:TPR repeat protein